MPAYDAELFTPAAPIARVALRHPETGNIVADVPMLIDSGADVTLLPRELVKRLDAVVASDGAYELMAFDGTKSIAQAVQLELLFLGRAFKGRFLLVDQAIGIMGRDVLNHGAILLDGPKLAWSES